MLVLGGLLGRGYSQIIYVSTTGNDTANGATPGTAMRTIQYGITNAVGRGWTDIYVSMGSYTPGSGLNTSATGRGVLITNHNLRLLGGWDTAFTLQSSGVTLLDGQSAVTNVLFVSNANNLFIDNFHITRGRAPGATPGYLYGYGGGMLLWKVNNGLFTNLTFSNNVATVGGGVCLLDSSLNKLSLNAISNYAGPAASTLIGGGGVAIVQATGFAQSNVVSGNLISNVANTLGTGYGGGLYLESTAFNVISARIISNWANLGGGIGAQNVFLVSSNLFSGDLIQNTANGGGGGIFLTGDQNSFSGKIMSNADTGAIGGGGVYLWGGNSNTFSGDFVGNYGSAQGGGFYGEVNSSNTTLSGNLIANRAVTTGGGAHLAGRSTVVSGNGISNIATGNGGAIYQAGGYGLFTGNFIENTNGGSGAGIYFASGSNTVIGSYFNRNRSGGGGGAMHAAASSNSMLTITATSNSGANGGVIMFSSSSSNVISGLFISNRASSTGGAISSLGNYNVMSGNFISNYVTVNFGGAVESLGNYSAVSGVMIGNGCAKWGGGLYVGGVGSVFTLDLYGNTSTLPGGGIALNTSHSNTISANLYTNTSSAVGGGIYVSNSACNLFNLAIYNSSTPLAGGGAYFADLRSNTLNLAVNNSSSGSHGGGIYCMNSSSNVFNANVVNCSANGHGGGIYFANGANNVVSGMIQSNAAAGNGGGVLTFGQTNDSYLVNLSSNFAGANGGALLDQNGISNSLVGNLLHNRAFGLGGAVYLLNANTFGLSNSLVSNNNSTAIDCAVALSNTGNLTNVVISNNLIGGLAASSGFAILESGNNIANHRVVGNGFIVGALGFLYTNIGGSVVSNFEITVMNTPGSARHNAGVASGNYLLASAATASFTSPYSWVTNIPASFASTSSAGSWIITNYLWTFGDGSSTQGPTVTSPNHVYTNFLSGFASLTIFDNSGTSNTASNAMAVYLFSLIGGRMIGTVSNAVLVTLNSAVTQQMTSSASNGVYFFVATNDTYTMTPAKLGYRFTPEKFTVALNNAPNTNNDFTARDIYPILTFKDADGNSLSDQQKVVRDLTLRVESDAPEILSTVSYSVTSLPGTPSLSTNFPSVAYGNAAILDTTRFQDGDYRLTATTIDTVFGRTHTTNLTVHFDNQLFKILDKGLENLKAIVYDTMRTIGKDAFVELFFYIPNDQTVRIDLYNKMGRLLKNVSNQKYFHGHNRVVLPMDIIPPSLPSGPYYLHFQTTSSSDINKSVLVVLTR